MNIKKKKTLILVLERGHNNIWQLKPYIACSLSYMLLSQNVAWIS